MAQTIFRTLIITLFVAVSSNAIAYDDSTSLWLPTAADTSCQVACDKSSPTITIAIQELQAAWQGQDIQLVVRNTRGIAPEGYRLTIADDRITITSPTDAGLLYGAYALLRKQAIGTIYPGTTDSNPLIPLRMLNHWDNLDGTIERGYAGGSLWFAGDSIVIDTQRLTDYARANASVGINATVINNVNATPQILSTAYLQKVKTLADSLRPYNIRLFLAVNFASPIVLDNLPTADPLDKDVIQWWRNKVKEIYALIPDFGGFLVKANSEGQPGPGDYHRSHADGANMLADALKPYHGTVLWRAFVYSPTDADRAKQAYLEFAPLDGYFRDNVIIQTKNGPIDFQPREPYSPLFTALHHTAQAAELQITQEYLGHSNHIIFLATMWKEFFRYVSHTSLQAIAGVANTGNDDNYCGNTFAQANWYAFGRLAWDATLTAEEIADEWIMQTFSHGREIINNGFLTSMLLTSRETLVNYMMPLGLHGLFAWGHHYGPEPWGDYPNVREDWKPVYYHRADSIGLGFDRTSTTGTNATEQYPLPYSTLYDNPETCPEEYLLWFHHLPWTYTLNSGNTLWQELCLRYQQGIDSVRDYQRQWTQLQDYLSAEQYKEGYELLITQHRDAIWWKDACLLFFQQHSHLPFPTTIDPPLHTLDDLQQLHLNISNYQSPTPNTLNPLR